MLGPIPLATTSIVGVIYITVQYQVDELRADTFMTHRMHAQPSAVIAIPHVD